MDLNRHHRARLLEKLEGAQRALDSELKAQAKLREDEGKTRAQQDDETKAIDDVDAWFLTLQVEYLKQALVTNTFTNI